MQDIKISNGHKLHVYLIEEKNIGDIFESVEESASAREDVMNNAEDSFNFKTSASNFIKSLEDRYCMAFIEDLTDELIKLIVGHWGKYHKERLDRPEYQGYLHRIECTNKGE